MTTADRTARPAAQPLQRAPIRVVIVMTDLDCGGAETRLLRLAEGVDRARIEMSVVSLHGAGIIGESLAALNVPVYPLNWKTVPGAPRALLELSRLIRSLRPDVVQGWMLHGNLAAALAALLSRSRAPLLWGVPHSFEALRTEKASTALLARALVVLAPRSTKIVYNSQRGAWDHEAAGFGRSRSVVIPNGFDCQRFRPRAGAREELRGQLAVPPETPLIGYVARVHLAKDHEMFLKAAALLAAAYTCPRFVLVGRGTAGPELAGRIAAAGLEGKVHTLGERRDVERIMAGLDICTSSSRAEGFPGAIGEAMACGIPCVATAAGDTGRLIGDTGRIVPRSDPAALQSAWADLLALSPEARRQLGAAARRRIVEQFSLQRAADQYEELYCSVLLRRAETLPCAAS
jgi:glycosyltransferase involved in cell wall biosynthesis